MLGVYDSVTVSRGIPGATEQKPSVKVFNAMIGQGVRPGEHGRELS